MRRSPSSVRVRVPPPPGSAGRTVSIGDRRRPVSTADELATLHAEIARLGLALPAAAPAQFAHYLALLQAWRERAGLTALADADAVQRRLFGESLALLVVLRAAGVLPRSARRRVADLGAGAGFPGVPMRLAEPALALTLIEAHGRRARFLELLAAELALDDVQVVAARAENAGRDPALREQFDVVVARALAPLAVLVEYALPLLRPGGVLATPKGSRTQEELRAAAG
ncbi:MAG: 16S rRNA (guanine(527)-N(7))-methyltransferase RsmG, partial [Chloroflexi bacterium]|nr:16S rRNA (guanine(527)-N(7))-methyltransferase RsmG [Chloroflexota bacterium]